MIFTVNGGVGPEDEVFHKHSANRISEKTDQKYKNIISWIRCKLIFIILRACLASLRGCRHQKVTRENTVVDDFAQACSDARLTT